jgi:hypothetical protein
MEHAARGRLMSRRRRDGAMAHEHQEFLLLLGGLVRFYRASSLVSSAAIEWKTSRTP